MKVKQGDIVWMNLDPTEGGEKGKTRPCLVLVGSGHPWEIVIVVPLTDIGGFRPAKLFVPISPRNENGLKKPSLVDTFQVRCVSESRIGRKLGQVTPEIMDEVRTRLAAILDIGEEHVT
ncbi:MAG: type II toxin-antitoxin system PemK/MazF family toxin [Pseudobdellovibrionaceae bacterium]|nr:type II toxin-antitoxin system PemK/MazF family toxin [Pseudobdellovibrionaceae bacterium]